MPHKQGNLIMNTIIENKVFEEERALYNLQNAEILRCRFEGELDGESALKEARNITVKSSVFSLRYPLWHCDGLYMHDSSTESTARAPIWYSSRGVIENSKIESIKALRECNNFTIKNSEIESAEFGWKCSDIKIHASRISGEYLFLDSQDIYADNITMKGKYSFQYINGLVIENSLLDTKDAFWHSKNVTVRNSVIKGEYLAWFSENVLLENCKIIGTQPFCYCKNLVLVNCETEGCDLSFEYSSVRADIIGHIDSVKNPKSGYILADSIGEIIQDQSIMSSDAKISIRK